MATTSLHVSLPRPRPFHCLACTLFRRDVERSETTLPITVISSWSSSRGVHTIPASRVLLQDPKGPQGVTLPDQGLNTWPEKHRNLSFGPGVALNHLPFLEP